MTSAASWSLLAVGAAGVGALWATGFGDPQGEWAPAFLLGYLAAWICYVAAGVIVDRARRGPRWVLLWIVAIAVAMRLVCLARIPPLSTDVWRYLWDGRVANAGIDPYRHPPNAPAVRHLRDKNWRRINFRHIPTIYPPAAQVLFAGLARSRDSDVEAFRWAFTAFDMASVLLLVGLLRRTGRPPQRVIWYAWCPLPVTEVTAGAHVDAFGLFLLLAALLAAARGSGNPTPASGIALAGATMAKGYTILALPFFVRRRPWQVLLAFGVTCLALLIPYLRAGRHLFAGLMAYLRAWETNSSVFLMVNSLLARATTEHFLLARVVTIAAILLVVALVAWRQKPGAEALVRSTFLALGAQLLLGAPTLPWYGIWLVPVLCWWSVPGVVLFSFTLSAQYYGRWVWGARETHYALLWAGYAPVYALLIGQLIWRFAAGRRSPSSRSP